MNHDLNTLLSDHQLGMSSFQDDYLVTARDGGTLYGQYKQALRELYKRLRGLVDEIYGEHGIKRLEQKLEKPTDEIEETHTRLLLDQARFHVQNTYREFVRFWQQASVLKDKIGELTPEKRRQFDEEMWIYRIKEMAVINYMQHRRLQNNTIGFLSSMPQRIREKLYPQILEPENHQSLIDEYMNRPLEHVEYEELPLPETVTIPQIESTILEAQKCLITA
jgi:hypothetical protein